MDNKKNYGNNYYGSIKIYVIGFISSIILTIIPFWMVIKDYTSKAITLGTIIITAIVQILVHLICFLHMNTKSDAGWNFIAFIFTLIIIAILITGSVWIMWNLNYNMMIY